MPLKCCSLENTGCHRRLWDGCTSFSVISPPLHNNNFLCRLVFVKHPVHLYSHGVQTCDNFILSIKALNIAQCVKSLLCQALRASSPSFNLWTLFTNVLHSLGGEDWMDSPGVLNKAAPIQSYGSLWMAGGFTQPGYF